MCFFFTLSLLSTRHYKNEKFEKKTPYKKFKILNVIYLSSGLVRRSLRSAHYKNEKFEKKDIPLTDVIKMRILGKKHPNIKF
jgi:hypothetical protein